MALRKHRYAKDPLVNRSLRHSLQDATAYSVMAGAGETYFSAFGLFLKATTQQIGVLATLPPLLGSLMQLLSAWIGQRTRRRMPVILTGVCLQACTWVPIMLLPMLFPQNAVYLLIGAVIVYYAGANLAAPLWSSLMGELVPERRRGRYFARRTRIASLVTFVALTGAGLVLHLSKQAGATALGYLIIFSLAAVARLVSVYHIGSMHEPERPAPPRGEPLLKAGWAGRVRRSGLVYFSSFVALMQCAVAISAPFFTVYMLRDLQFTYLQFMANTAAAVLTQYLTLTTWGRLSDAFGNRLILVITGSVIPLLPALWLVSSDFRYLLLVQVLGGVGWAGFSLSSGNFLYDLIPSTKRAPYLALHNVVVAVGVFLGAMLGGLLAVALPRELALGGMHLHWIFPLQGVFVVSTVARLLVAGVFLHGLREVRTVRVMSVRQLVFRVARFNALQGLFFDVVTGFRRKPDAASPIPDSEIDAAGSAACSSRQAQQSRVLSLHGVQVFPSGKTLIGPRGVPDTAPLP